MPHYCIYVIKTLIVEKNEEDVDSDFTLFCNHKG